MIHFRKRYIFYSVIGMVSFIFFGFFFPILILPVPIEEETFTGRLVPTSAPVAAAVSGKDVVMGALSFIGKTRLTPRIDKVRCFKERRGETGNCQTSDTSDLLPGYLIQVYDKAAGFDGEARLQDDYRDALTTTLDLCRRNMAACKSSFIPLYREYRKNSDERLARAIRETGTELLSNPSASFVSFSQDVGKLVILYRLTGDRAYLVEALTRVGDAATVAANDPQNAVIAFDESVGGNIRRFDCGLFGDIYLSVYPQVHDEAFLTKSREFFTLVPRFVNRMGTAAAVGLCLDGLATLSSEFDDPGARELREKVLNYTLNAYWDFTVAPKFNRDGGFLLSDYELSATNQVFNFKYPLEHAWILSHVVEFPDTVFHLKGTNL